MLIYLALSACSSLVADTNAAPLVPEATVTPAKPAPMTLPSGKATLRTCDLSLPNDVLAAGGLARVMDDEAAREEGVGRGTLAQRSGGGYGAGPSTGLGGAGAKGRAANTTRSPSAASPKSAPAPAVAYPAAAPSGAHDIAFESLAMPDLALPGDAAPMASLTADGNARAEKKAERAAPSKEATLDELAAMPLAKPSAPRAPGMDWGATVFLSNDDSMSLASAQRLLWAVQNRGPVSPAQVRPHELLNYFSFDTVAPAQGEVFGVSGSAAPLDDDTLTLAFAVEGARPERQPLDLTVVLDRSGSMSAEGRMAYLKRGLQQMAGQLVRGDRVNVVLFDHESCAPLEGYVHGRDDARLLTGVVDALQPRGSTDLDLGLRDGYRLANRDVTRGRNSRVLLISDALLNTGNIDPGTVSEVSRAYEGKGVRLSAIGVGRDFNDQVLDMLTEKGKGAYAYLGSEAVVDRIFGAGFESLVQTVAHDVHFSVDLPESLAMKRFYGEEASTVKEDVQPIHYYAGTKQLFLQDVEIRDGRVPRGDLVTFHVEYTDALTGKKAERSWSSTVGDLLAADDRNLRKGRALMGWTDLILARALGNDPCGSPFATWQDRVAQVGEDAELAWLDGMTSPLCATAPVAQTPRPRGVDLKVRVDSDVPIAEVAVACGSSNKRAALNSGGNVARFTGVTPGSCTVTLDGIVPMVASLQVPTGGGQANCRVRGGRLGCS